MRMHAKAGSWLLQLNQYFLEMAFQDITASQLTTGCDTDGAQVNPTAPLCQPEQIQALLS